MLKRIVASMLNIKHQLSTGTTASALPSIKESVLVIGIYRNEILDLLHDSKKISNDRSAVEHFFYTERIRILYLIISECFVFTFKIIFLFYFYLNFENKTICESYLLWFQKKETINNNKLLI